eukprot:5058049-Amphidinium_carterae.1
MPTCLPATLVDWPGAPRDLPLPLEITEDNVWLLDQTLLKDYARSFTRRLRSRLRSCKKAWTDLQCEHSQTHFGKREAHEAFNLIKKVSGTLPKRIGNALALSDGSITQDPAIVNSMWLSHWQKHFTATQSKCHSFKHRNIEGSAATFQSAEICDHNERDLWITAREVQQLVARTNPRKSAPDLCPHKCWPLLGQKFEESVARSINVCLREGRIPDAWSGSMILWSYPSARSSSHHWLHHRTGQSN